MLARGSALKKEIGQLGMIMDPPQGTPLRTSLAAYKVRFEDSLDELPGSIYNVIIISHLCVCPCIVVCNIPVGSTGGSRD